MNCRNCMTRVSAGMRRCPNCGRDLAHPAPGAEDTEAPVLAPPPVPRGEGRRESDARERAPREPRTPSAKLAALTLEPADVRVLVAASPERIEPGLRVYEDGGRAVGAGFPTAVGEIDLLARDDAGGLVVVMVADGEPDKDAVLELLQRIGFVRTRVARSGEEVRGLLLVERLSAPTRYTIAALGDTVSVKAWRVALTFDDLPV
jgi:hypothetical protein